MNINAESHFAQLPQVNIERSIFNRDFNHKTSFNTGELIPFYWDEVLPGDTFNITTSVVCRLQTLLTPIMDNVDLDISYFFVPMRLVWSHTKEFFGENTGSAWIPQSTYQIPAIKSPSNGWNVGTIADYMGIPPGVEFLPTASGGDNLLPSALPLRAYALIANEWWRDQNLTPPLYIPVDDTTQTGSNGSSYVNDVANGGKPFKVAKYHDLFTSCLPDAQKHDPVKFPLVNSKFAPVYSTDSIIPDYVPLDITVDKQTGMIGKSCINGGTTDYLIGFKAGPSNASTTPGQTSQTQSYYHNTGTYSDYDFKPLNLWADLRTSVGMVSINQLRLSFQLQKFYEKMARGGSRYRETILMQFGTTSPDARMMIPEYLGGHRIPIQIHQIVNSAQSSGEPLGDVGAMSNTADVHEDVSKSFSEHGFIIGCCCLRYLHSYPQGLSREWTRKSMTDYYWPVFASIGEQPRYVYEVDATNYTGKDRRDVFGYNEAWAEYRFKPDRISGELRPGITNSLASWHLADYYQAQPELSDSWIREDPANVDRVLAVTSATAMQAFADFYVKNTCTRCMPMYSVPGLIDHF